MLISYAEVKVCSSDTLCTNDLMKERMKRESGNSMNIEYDMIVPNPGQAEIEIERDHMLSGGFSRSPWDISSLLQMSVKFLFILNPPLPLRN